MRLIVIGPGSPGPQSDTAEWCALLVAFAGRGHDVTLLLRSGGCVEYPDLRIDRYADSEDLLDWRAAIGGADAVIVMDSVAEAPVIAGFVQHHAGGVAALYQTSETAIDGFDLYLSPQADADGDIVVRAAQLEARLEGAIAQLTTVIALPVTPAPLTVVAGGAGFIGSHLCRALLDRGAHVLCIDNLQTARASNLIALEGHPHFTFVRHDVTRPLPPAVTDQASRITRIYNLACAASPPAYQNDPEHTMLTNVLGTTALLRLAEAAGARFLLTSTSEVYGDPEVHPQPEGYRGAVNCTGPRACYDEGKRAAEAMTFDFARMARADVRVARIFNTYGPQMDPADGRVISNLLCQALSGAALTIYGDGSQTRSFCYVSDLVDGLIRLMESPDMPAEPVNLGNPGEFTIGELVDRVVALTGTTAGVEYHALPVDDPTRRRPDIGRARMLLDWEPCVPLADGLATTCQWFAEELGVSTIDDRPKSSIVAH